MIALAFLLITLAYADDNIVNLAETVDDSYDKTYYFSIDSTYIKAETDSDTKSSECFYYDNKKFIKFFEKSGAYSFQIYTDNTCLTTEIPGSTEKGLTNIGTNDLPPKFFTIEYSNGKNDAEKKIFNKYITTVCSNNKKYERTNLGAFRIQYQTENGEQQTCAANKRLMVIDYCLYPDAGDNIKFQDITKFEPAQDYVKQDTTTVTNLPPVEKTLETGKTPENYPYALIFDNDDGYWMTNNEISQQNKLYPVTDQSPNVIATIKKGDKITEYIFSTKDSSNNQYMIFGKYLIKVTYNANSEIEGTIQLSYKNGLNDDKEGNPTAVFTQISSEKTYYEVQGTTGYSKYKTVVCEKKSENNYFMFDNVKSANQNFKIAKVEKNVEGNVGGNVEDCKPVQGNTITLLEASETKPSLSPTVGEIDTDRECTVKKSEENAAEVQYMVIGSCIQVGENEFKKITVENNQVIEYKYTSNECKESTGVPREEYGTCNTCNTGTEKGFMLICDTSSDVSSSEPKINDDSSNEPKVNDVSSSTPKVNDDSSNQPKINDDSSNQPKINDDSSSQTKMNNDSSTNNKPPPPSSGASPSSMFITMLLVIFVFLF